MLRRDTRRRLDQFIANPNCQANVLSAVHDIPMLDVARSLGEDPQSGQSPFAIGRGIVFERSLYADGAERLFAALVAAGVLPASATGFVDLRTRRNGGEVQNLDDARARFLAMLQGFAAAGDDTRAALPAIVAAPALRIPGRAILPDGMFAVDVVTVHPAPRPAKVVLRVGEIKVYPDRGGHTDPHQLASTRAQQAGIYVHALRLAVDAAGVGGEVEVSDEGFLVLTRPGSNAPSVRAHEDLRFQAKRAERAFERLREAAALAEALPGDTETEAEAVPKPRLAVVAGAPKAYDEACVSFCELAGHCHAAAVRDESPAVLGRDVARFLGAVSLGRAAALLGGGRAETAAEEDFVRRASDAAGARSVA
jgi:hypothetical protein